MEQSKLTSEWIQTFNRLGSEGKLKPTVPYHDLFNRKELKGFSLHTLPMWTVNFPTGHITCCDPLVTLPSKPDTYLRTVEPGTYLLETKIIEMEPNEYRYVASRVVFSGNEPVYYELALKGTEDLTDLDDGDTYIGFPVDSGLSTIVDAQTIETYNKFYEQWHINYPEKNIYDDYYSDLFQLNAMAYPQFQRSKGDWINFTIPDTELTVPMIQSGFGDGLYPVYWAFDKDGQICQIIMEYIDCSEAYE